MTSFDADHDMHAPLDGRARQRIVWGGVDPGSARIGVAAATGEPGALVSVMTPVKVEVGYLIEHDPPIVKKSKKGLPYEVKSTRINGNVEVDHACAVVLAHLRLAGVTHLAIEQAEKIYVSEPGVSMATNMMVSDRVATILRLAATAAGIHVVTVQAATWRGRLRKLLQAVTPDEAPGKGDAVRGHGTALGHVLRAHIVGWPTGSDDNQDTRDAGGIVLWQALPAIDRPTKRAPGQRRAKRPRGAGRRAGAEAAATQGKAKRAAERAAAGCACVFSPTGSRHAKGCPLGIVPKTLVVSDACVCSPRCSFLGPECPGRRSARRAKVIA